MTHVLDEAIERVMKIGAAMQEALACDGAEEHLVDQWSEAERDLDRILRAERDRDHESEEYERVVSEGQRDEVMREQGRAEERCHATGFLNELMEELSEEPRAQVVVDVIRRRLLQGDHWRGGEG